MADQNLPEANVIIPKQNHLTNWVKKRLRYIIPVLIFTILLSILSLNYFRLIKLSQYLPSLSFLPVKPDIAMRIDGQVITNQQFNEVLSHFQKNLNDRQKGMEVTTNLFIADALLKKETEKQGYAFTTEGLNQYIAENKIYETYKDATLPLWLKLDLEVTFLRDQFFTKSLTWYSGFVFLARLISPKDESMIDPRYRGLSAEERGKLAEKKIEEIRQLILTDASFETIDNKLSKDEQLKKINTGQAWGLTFEKMSIDRPAIISPEVLSAIKSLKKDEVSEIIRMTDPKSGSDQPFALAVLKLTDVNLGIADSFEAWFENAKNTAKIEIFAK